MQREVIKWLQTLDLSTPVKNPNRDLANGVAAAEIVSRYAAATQMPLQSITTGVSADSRRNNWQLVVKALEGMGCTSIRADLVDELLRHQPNAGVTVLENLYEFLTQRQLPMRSLNTDDKVRPYISAKTVPSATAFLDATMDAAAQERNGRADKTASAPSLSSSPQQTKASSSSAAVRLPALTASSSAAVTRRVLGMTSGTATSEAESNTEEVSYEAAQRVQQQLALTANQELAVGHAAAKRQPRYAQPTAASLLRPANDTRQDVSLAKAKFAPDTKKSNDRNLQLLAEHEAVKDWKGQSAANQKRKAAEEDAKLLLPHAVTGADRGFLLTTLLRGPYSTARIGRRRSQRGAGGGSGSEPSHRIPGGAASQGVGSGGSARASVGARTGTAPELASHVKKVNVNVLGPGLLQALERSGAMNATRQVADERSIELFRQSGFSLRKGISCLLQDVLASQRDLVTLVERCAESGEGDALEDLLLAVICHREALPMDTLRACWASLEQNVVGIAAAVCERPDEYHYLLTAVSFAFSLDSAQVPLLHVTADAESGDDDGLYGEDETTAGFNDDTTTLPFGSTGAGAGRSRGGVAAPAMAPRHRSQSVGEALLAATRRSSITRARRAAAADADAEDEEGAADESIANSQSLGGTGTGSLAPGHVRLSNGSVSTAAAVRQRTVRFDSSTFHLASAFVFMTHLGAAIRERDALMAEQVLVRFFLPAAETALLPHGSTAMVEAVARVLTAHLCGSATTLADAVAANGTKQLDETIDSYQYTIEFLFDTLRPFLDGAFDTDAGVNARKSAGTQRQREAFHLYVYHVVRQLVSLALDARALIDDEEEESGDEADNAHKVALFNTSVYALATDLFAQLHPILTTCFTQGVEMERAIAVALLAQLATLIVDAPSTMAEAVLADGPKRALLHWVKQWIVDALLQHGAAVFFPSAFAASGWELKVVTLELLTLLHRKMLAWRVALLELGAKQLSSGDPDSVTSIAPGAYDLCLSPPRLERATCAVLKLFARSPPLQRQLALTVVGRRLLPDTQPHVALQWLDCLLGFPADLFKASLLPYESRPMQMRRPTAVPQDGAGGTAGRNTLPGAGGALTFGRQEGWLDHTADNGGDDGPDGSPLDMSSIQMLLGRVEPEYVVAPLNQTWDTCSVVQTALRHVSRLHSDQVMAIVAAALLSPQPLETQREQLARNVAQLTSATTTLVELSDDEDADNPKHTPVAGHNNHNNSAEDGDDGSAFAATLRDLAGTTGGSRVGQTSSSAHSAKAGSHREADSAEEDPAGMERHFWLATLQTVLPLIEQTLFDGAKDGDDVTGDAKQTAAAVLFTLFRRYAPSECLSGHMDGQELLDRSVDWASTV